jgi:hypothetical protein
VRLLKQSSESGEDCSDEVLFPQRCTFFERKPVLSQVIICDATGRNPGLKRTQADAIFIKFYMKTILKLKINLIRNTLNWSCSDIIYIKCECIVAWFEFCTGNCTVIKFLLDFLIYHIVLRI